MGVATDPLYNRADKRLRKNAGKVVPLDHKAEGEARRLLGVFLRSSTSATWRGWLQKP